MAYVMLLNLLFKSIIPSLIRKSNLRNMASILPSLPSAVISNFGESLRATIDKQIIELVDLAIVSDEERENSFKQVNL